MAALSLIGSTVYAKEARTLRESGVNGQAAQEESRTLTMAYNIYFRQDKWDIDPSYLDNAITLKRLKEGIDSLIAKKMLTTDLVLVISAASPDGRSGYNMRLSEKRGESAVRYIKKLYPQLNTDLIIRNAIGEDWGTMKKIALEDENIPNRKELLILIDSDLSPKEKELWLRDMRPTFDYILKKYIHLMRAAAITVQVTRPAIALQPVTPPVTRIEARTEGGLVQGRSYLSGGTSLTTKPFNTTTMIFALRTNLLVPALNFGIEVPIKYNWSVGADYYFPWWLAKSNKYCAEMLGWFIDTKYWFGRNRTEEDKLTGHALGIYAGGGYYDFQWLYKGAQGEFIDVGIDYTYAVPVAKGKLRMEFNLGVGWVGTRARLYTPTDDFQDLIKEQGVRHRDYNFFGPTRASISLVVPIRAKSKKKTAATPAAAPAAKHAAPAAYPAAKHAAPAANSHAAASPKEVTR